MRHFSGSTRRNFKTMVAIGALSLAIGGLNPLCEVAAQTASPEGKLLAGDFHQHTYYTDGSTSMEFVMQKNYEFGLDWWTNSEHGGSRNRDGQGNYWDDTTIHPKNPIQGDLATSSDHEVMWRWQSLRDFAYADILKARSTYWTNRIFSGLEWNVPGHEHCSIGVLAQDASAVSAFEFQFDKSDHDTSRKGEVTPFGALKKYNGYAYTFPGGVKTVTAKTYPEMHADSVRAAKWMERKYKKGLIDDAWIIFAHIERAGSWTSTDGGGYNIEHFRDFNNAAPHICYGFEGAPGHQVNSDRGGFSPDGAFGGTYGGVGYYSATVGGLWDALLGEGRNWYNFASSDYHRHHTNCTDGDCGDDFYPGEYQKTYVYTEDTDGDGNYSLKEIATGMRSGNSFFAMGDLINYLDFSATKGNRTAKMGGTLVTRSSANEPVTITIKFKSPATNSNGDSPTVNHIDLISGDITGKIDPSDPEYATATNATTKVLARFTSSDWVVDQDGNNVITFSVTLANSTYFRLRGSNLPVNTANETDADGNPLADSLATANLGLDGAAEAWADLWFYSNPIFVKVK